MVFEAVFLKGRAPGIGLMMYPNGDTYYGQHKDFLREG